MEDSTTLVTWLSQCSVDIEVTLVRAGNVILGPRRVDLIAEIDRTRSISAAARNLGISYRHAWLIVQEINTAANKAFVEANVGGKKGGGARLTDQGRAALTLFTELQSTIRVAAAQSLPRALGLPLDRVPCVHLLAAVSLQDAIGQLLADFTLKRPDVRVRTIFGASNELADHVLSGSPADLFISANDSCLDRIESNGWIVPGSRQTIGANGLSFVAHESLNHPFKELADLKTLQGEPVAIADASSPLGSYTQTWLKQDGVYDTVAKTALTADNSRGVVSILSSKRARIGIVFSSELSRLPEYRVLTSCKAKDLSISYVAAVLSRGQRQNDAEDLLTFLTSPEAQRQLRNAGIAPSGCKVSKKIAPKSTRRKSSKKKTKQT